MSYQNYDSYYYTEKLHRKKMTAKITYKAWLKMLRKKTNFDTKHLTRSFLIIRADISKIKR